MGERSVWLLLVAATLLAGGCAGPEPDSTATIGFTAIDLPAGAVPEAVASSGDAVLVGIRRPAAQVRPSVLRRTPDGASTELAVHGATPYGLEAHWYSIASDGERIVGLGGERGGAHGNVRWSAWTGSASAGVTEKMQAFSTFGGYGAGELLDAVQTTAGPALVGTWASARAGLDVAVWTFDGESWVRQSSAGSVLESVADSLGFPIAATSSGAGIVVAGWELTSRTGSRGEAPVVWRSASLDTGWTRTALPDAGQSAAAMAVECRDSACVVAGRVDGRLAMWRLTGSDWSRMPGVPAIPVGDKDKLAPPVEVAGHLVEVVADGGQVKVVRADGERWDTWSVRAASGPSGAVTAASAVGDTIYVLAGQDEDHQRLWRVEAGSLG